MKFTSAAAVFGFVAVSQAYSNGTATSGVASATGAAATDCEAQHNACQTAPNANMSYCASKYAECLGYNPYASNGTLTATAASNAGVAYVTEVVTSFTTYCPASTTLTFNHKTYTISSATTLTITDCPCTLTHSTSSAWASATAGPVAWNTTASNATAVAGKPTTLIGSATTQVEHVTAYTTYCPSATTLTIGSSTYTVSKATTLVISASTPFAVTETKSAYTSVITPAAAATTGSNKNSTVSASASATVSHYQGAASANTVAGTGALLAFIGSLALLF